MTQPQAMSKTQLLDGLRSGQRRMLDQLGALPAEEFEQGCYEGGWNGRQVLAHIASIEWSYRRLIDIAEKERASPANEEESQPQVSAAPRSGVNMNDYNLRQVEKRAQMSVAELLDEFRQNRDATIAAVEQADDALFTRPVRSAGGLSGPLSNVLFGLTVAHAMGHMNDILRSSGARDG